MLTLALWLLAAPPAPAPAPDDTPRWVLIVELPRTVDVAGVGLLPLRMRAGYLLRGPLSSARAEPCFIEVESALARASATTIAPSLAPLSLVERAGSLRSDDAQALMPAGPVGFELRAAGVGLSTISAEVNGRLSLEGRRDGAGASGEARLHRPSDRVVGPGFVRSSFASVESVRGRFSLEQSAAERCADLSQVVLVEGVR